ncbi:MAG: phosphate propanoyltransferase [Treponema sp.]|jgi:propanediol utilization protein|nr:phosphate propanoyltransferase [Treponema sp.]
MEMDVDKEAIRKIVEHVLEKKGILAASPASLFPGALNAAKPASCPALQETASNKGGPTGGGRPDTAVRIPAEASARHVHLTPEAAAVLFGPGALTPKRALSQPGEFLSGERVRLIGPKGEIGNVAVLGPVRKAVQAEVSLTDARILGIKAPLRLSGDLTGAADVYIAGPAGAVHARGAAIIAKNHLHLRPQDAGELKVENGGRVRVRVNTERPLIFEDVIVRVREDFMPALHLDFDEANACMLGDRDTAEILDCGAGACPSPERRPAFAPADAGSKSIPSKPALITEAEAKRLVCGRGGRLSLPRGSILTPSAQDVFLYARCKVEFI